MDGVVTGIVKNNWSEDFPGKLMVEYTLGEAGKMETGWLPFMTGYAGPGYGGYQMPEIGAEVVIGFHSGDSRRPIVLGCLWNQTNTPPEQTSNEKNSKKLWRSREGYQVLLNEDEDALELSFSTTIQRETKLFLGADNEETAELTVPMYDFGDWASKMKAYRKKNHITQQELAQLMGVKHFTLRSWEQKQAKPPYNVWRLHKHLFDDSIKLT